MRDSSRLWRVYVLPAAVFQSVVIGGGYGTGREIVEYFTRFGAAGGLFGLVTVMACLAVLMAMSYEFARQYKAYDYRRFFRELLGPGWIAFEILYLVMFALVLAVIAAAAGKLFQDRAHIPGVLGISLLLLLVIVLVFFGRQWVTRMLAFKAALLSAVFVVYFFVIASSATPAIIAELRRMEILRGWVGGALHYTLYSSVVIPAMLFATAAIRTRREAFISGAISATCGMIPGILLQLSFAAGYPAVLHQAIPAYWMIAGLSIRALTAAYLVVLFGCLLDTGLCFIQSVNERVDGWRLETHRPPLSRAARVCVAIACAVASGGLSLFGVVRLIAQGYGTMAWGFLVLYVAPIMTIGVRRLTHPQ